MKAQFEYAQKEDLAAIVKIYNQAVPTKMATADLQPVSKESKQSWFNSFNQQERPIWKITVYQQIVGWVSLEYFYGRPAYCHTAEISLYIDQHSQRCGLGQQALSFVFSQLSSLQLDTLVAYIFSHNYPSLALFQKNGFVEWGNLPAVATIDNKKCDLKILGRHFD